MAGAGRRLSATALSTAPLEFPPYAETTGLWAPETVRKRRELLEGKLLPFCETKGYALLSHLDVDVLRTFRASWPYSPLSARKRLEYLRSFFRFCHDSGWVSRNPALAVKGSKVEPKVAPREYGHPTIVVHRRAPRAG